MCGILAAWDWGIGVDDKLFYRALEQMRQRGPDAGGVFRRDDVRLGHRRLSIIDLSDVSNQPMTSPDGRYTIVYNGEIYNYRNIRQRLIRKQYHFRSQSDTEVILNGFIEWGRNVVQELSGIFAFVIFDGVENTLFVARDKIGVKPLYFHVSRTGFLCASSLGPLMSLSNGLRTLDRNSLRLYLETLGFPAPYSAVRGIQKLKPGTCLMVAADRSVKEWVYWDIMGLEYPTVGNPRSLREQVDELESLLGLVVEEQLVSDVPLGLFLSGGVDSSLLLALMVRAGRRDVRAYTVSFPQGSYDEGPYAAEVARHFGANLVVEVVDAERLRQLARNVEAISDEPLADTAIIPLALLSGRARTEITVALSGDGGDEIFGGYGHYRLLQLIQRAEAVGGPLLRLMGNGPRVSARSYRLRRLLSLVGANRDWVTTYSRIRSFCRDVDVDRLLLKKDGITLEEHYRSLFPLPPDARSPFMLDAAARLDMRVSLEGDMLVKSDRASMAHSLELRVPWLDSRIVEFGQRIPFRIRRYRGQGKTHLKRIARPLVPRSVVTRGKRGFLMPLRAWFREGLAEECFDADTYAVLDGLGTFDMDYVHLLVSEHTGGRRNCEWTLWSLYCLARWARAYGAD